MGWTKMIDMALDDEDKADMVCPMPIGMNDRPEYPYGLRITLCTPELRKADLDVGDICIGDIVDIRGLAKVTSISSNDGPHGKECRVELQFEHMAFENESTEETPEPPARKRSPLYSRREEVEEETE